MIATPNGSSIVFQGIPENTRKDLSFAFEEAKQSGLKEAAVIAIQNGDFNLQVVMVSGRYSLVERISRNSAVRDFKAVVQRLSPSPSQPVPLVL